MFRVGLAARLFILIKKVNMLVNVSVQVAYIDSPIDQSRICSKKL